MSAVLCCFDPGPHTGVAVFVDGKVVSTVTHMHGDDPADLYRHIEWSLLAARARSGGAPIVVLCEAFRTRAPSIAASHAALETVRVTGWIEGLARVRGEQFVWIEPQAKLAYARAARDLAPGSTPHAGDAVALGLAWLAREETRHAPTHPF